MRNLIRRGDAKIGLRKVVAFKEKCFAAGMGEGVCEAVAKVQRGGMNSSPEAPKREESELAMVDRHRLNREIEASNYDFQFAASSGTELAFEDYTGFHDGNGRD